MCMPSGTRQASTQISQVFSFFPPPFTGTGFSVSMVVQSMSSALMICVPKVTVPLVAALSPVLVKVTVTYSHRRRSEAARTGALTVSRAGAALAAGAVVDGAEEAG